MKLQPEYQNVKTRFENIKKDAIIYAGELKSKGGYKDFLTQFAWDTLHATFKPSEICAWYDKYGCNDTHIYTLVKKVVQDVFPEL